MISLKYLLEMFMKSQYVLIFKTAYKNKRNS